MKESGEIMERNKKIDIVRALSIILIVVYHCWVLTGSVNINNKIIYTFVSLGGEIGVTAFFALSGYGIYCSHSNSGEIQKGYFAKFMKKRCFRILPQYYFCFIVALLIGTGAGYLSVSGIPNLLTHIFLIHNLIPRYSGTINGVLWTMGVIFQFYIISVILYKMMKKRPNLTIIGVICFTIISKALVYIFIGNYYPDAGLSFWAGRQLVTALDNFAIGMYVANLVERQIYLKNTFTSSIILAIGLAFMYIVCRLGFKYGIHTNNISGYMWHSWISISIGIIMIGISGISLNEKSYIFQGFMFIAHHEYGIYLWHLLIILNLVANSPTILGWINKGYYFGIISTLSIICIGFGIIVNYIFEIVVQHMIDKINRKYRNENECK